MSHEIMINGLPDDLYFHSMPGILKRDEIFPIIGLFLDDDAVFFDVGANIGGVLIATSKCLKRGRVYGFEPSRKNFELLKHNVDANRLTNASIYNIALGRSDTTLSFVTEQTGAYSHVLTDGCIVPGTQTQEKVDVRTLDGFVLENKIDRIDFIKIDVEGYEKEVIAGAKKTIRKFDPIVYAELNSWALLAFRDKTPWSYIQFLRSTFEYIYVMKDRTPTRLTSDRDFFDFLTANLVEHGCVDNLIMRNSDLFGRKSWDVLLAERKVVFYKTGILDSVRHWRIMAPLRFIWRKMRAL